MRKIIHIDMDAFFASVEQRDRPELRGKPVIVGGSPKRRGVVSTCSYEARAFGVHSAMPTATALRLCPQATLIEPDFRRYQAASLLTRELFLSVTDLVEPVSIDECYLDVTENRLHRNSATRIAEYLQREIFLRTDLTASAGISYNKFLAKVASDYRKPAGLTVITPEEAPRFLDALPIARFHGIGEVSAKKLAQFNIKTGRELRQLPRETLHALFGKAGDFYYDIVRGIDDRPVEPEGDPKSISRETTLPSDTADRRKINIVLRTLSRKVMRRTLKQGFLGRTLTVKVRFGDFRVITRSETLPQIVSNGEELGRRAVLLADKADLARKPVRLLGVGLSNLVSVDAPRFEQLYFDFNPRKGD
ncbi:MAG: DNA polymerase IV [Victivallaceae bacterium]|nr:DNA polymerase IV [Victivallaceae bacterium]